MPAKNAILPRFSSSASTATAPVCAIASTISTPGITGRPGKWPGNHQSSARISRWPTTRLPGSSSSISSTSRNGARCGRIASITSRPNGGVGIVMQRCLRVARAVERGRGARSTSPCRPASRRRGDLLEREAERVLQEHDLRLLRRDARRAPCTSSRRSSECRRRAPGRPPDCRSSPSGSWTRAFAPLDDVEARVDDEPVQPRRELGAAAELLQADAELGERLLGRVARVLGIARKCSASRSTRGACRVSSASSAWRSPSFARFTRIGSLSFS